MAPSTTNLTNPTAKGLNGDTSSWSPSSWRSIMACVADIQYDVMLGRPWQAVHQPQIRWKEGTVVSESDWCSLNCNSHPLRSPVALSIEHTRHQERMSKEVAQDYDIFEVSATTAYKLSQRHEPKVYTYWVQEIGKAQVIPYKPTQCPPPTLRSS